jgi:para-aminobenzoate synthetase/4-amino-4-deoxychorismate lyase
MNSMNDILAPGTVFIQRELKEKIPHGLLFSRPTRILAARSPTEVLPLLRSAEEAVEHGHWAAGFISYEAASAFDPALRTHSPSTLPVAWLGIYTEPAAGLLPCRPDASFEIGGWQPSIAHTEYRKAIRQIKADIYAGDTYQVNFTFHLQGVFRGDPSAFTLALCQSQGAHHGALVAADEFVICSASPELFLTLAGTRLVSRPMKGTTLRGLSSADDRQCADLLLNSEKNRAENIMIVDMVRNDMGRIATMGTVQVSSLFDIERYPTVWQMTSTVEAVSSASLGAILSALFPCASVTGAPKVHTMGIIAQLEKNPRGVYCGAIGYFGPARQAKFNVAIRTAVIWRSSGAIEYGTGSGIVWDSNEIDEYDECLAKARILSERLPDFKLLETLLWEPGSGYFLRDRHLDRMQQSAIYFDFPFRRDLAVAKLIALEAQFAPLAQRVRLCSDRDGRLGIEVTPHPSPRACPLRVALHGTPVDSKYRFLYHKTTCRQVYDAAKASRPDCDDVLLWNERRELTESTIANIVIRKNSEWLTPPVESGLLAGVFRNLLLEEGKIRETILTLDDVRRADELYLINSVRRWTPAVLV